MGVDGSTTTLFGGCLTSRAIEAIRESCSGVRFFSNSTPSSAITFSTILSPAISIYASRSQQRHCGSRHFCNIGSSALGSVLNLRCEPAQPEFARGSDGTCDQPWITRANQLADGLLRRLWLDTEQVTASFEYMFRCI